MTHDTEIEKRWVDGRRRYRVLCSCGFPGPWRKTRKTAVKDGEDHEDRRACGEA